MKEKLKEMTLDELEELRKAVLEEISSRRKDELVLYTHSCKNSSKHHMRKYKHWTKVVSGVDTTKTNGYAFLGKFLYVDAEHKLPVGSIIVEACGGSITAYRLTQAGKEEIGRAGIKALSGLIEKLATYF